MKVKSLFLIFVFLLLVYCAQQGVWIETSQSDFADGTFDGGGNLYASWAGDVRVVNSWDLNGDGWLDIIFSNYSSDLSYNIDSDIYWGSSDGFNLERKTSLPTHAAIAYAIADCNNDGFLDVIFGSWQSKEHDINGYGSNGTRRFFGSYSLVYWGSNSGFHKESVSEIYTYAPTGIEVADMNNDGFLDLTIASSRPEGEVVIYWGNKNGYTKERTTEIPAFRSMVAYPVDLNGDNILDLIATSLERASFSRIYFGNKEGFSDSDIQDLETSYVRSVAVADLNRDGFLDIIFANGGSKDTYMTDSFIYWGSNEGYSESRRTLLPTILAMQPAVADLDKDGYLDIVFANCYDGKRYDVPSYIYYGSEEGFGVKNRKEIPTCGAHSIALADYDENGEIDLVFSSAGDPEGKTVNYYSQLFYQKKGEFSPADLRFPIYNGHHNTNRDLGNIYDRKYRDTYVSSVCDAQRVVAWDRIEWDAEIPEGCNLKMFVRAADSSIENQRWREVEKKENFERSLKFRFFQYKVVFYYNGKGIPRLDEVRVYYK